MAKLNWEIILYNLVEAREQIEQIEKLANSEKKPSEIEFQIKLLHAYHHLNFAWNIRHASTKSYAKLTEDDFNKWGKYPTDIEDS